MPGNKICDIQCYSTEYNFDSMECKSTECPCDTSLLGNGVCNKECLIDTCLFDYGDCCTAELLLDENCDYECYYYDLDYDRGRCNPNNECSCDSSILGDGVCNWECVSNQCSYDYGDCCEN